MTQDTYTKKIAELLNHANIEINGSNSWDIQVHNSDLFKRIIGQGSLGLSLIHISEPTRPY